MFDENNKSVNILLWAKDEETQPRSLRGLLGEDSLAWGPEGHYSMCQFSQVLLISFLIGFGSSTLRLSLTGFM